MEGGPRASFADAYFGISSSRDMYEAPPRTSITDRRSSLSCVRCPSFGSMRARQEKKTTIATGFQHGFTIPGLLTVVGVTVGDMTGDMAGRYGTGDDATGLQGGG